MLRFDKNMLRRAAEIKTYTYLWWTTRVTTGAFASPENARRNPGSGDVTPDLTNRLSARPGPAEITEPKSPRLLSLIDTAADYYVNYRMGFANFSLRHKQRVMCRPRM